MSDAHGAQVAGHGDAHVEAHVDAHGAADAHAGGGDGGSGGGWNMWSTRHTDNWYDAVATYVSEEVRTFVAFIFFLITVGAIFGALVAARNPAMEPIIILLPAVLGLIAFYNRDIATLFFFLFIVAFIIV